MRTLITEVHCWKAFETSMRNEKTYSPAPRRSRCLFLGGGGAPPPTKIDRRAADTMTTAQGSTHDSLERAVLSYSIDVCFFLSLCPCSYLPSCCSTPADFSCPCFCPVMVICLPLLWSCPVRVFEFVQHGIRLSLLKLIQLPLFCISLNYCFLFFVSLILPVTFVLSLSYWSFYVPILVNCFYAICRMTHLSQSQLLKRFYIG